MAIRDSKAYKIGYKIGFSAVYILAFLIFVHVCMIGIVALGKYIAFIANQVGL